MKTQINEIKRMQQLAGILKEGVEVPSWLPGKLKDVHTKPGQGSIFAKSIEDVLKLVQDALDKEQDIDKIANSTGTKTIKSSGIGYNLVLPIEQAKKLPGAKESEVEKIEGPNKIKVPAITTTAPLTQFKTDDLTVIVRPKKDESGTVIPSEYIVLSAFPGDPTIPRASEWNGKYAVIIPGGKEEIKEGLQYFHNGSEMNQIINYDDSDITDDLESFGQGSMDGQDFRPGKIYNIGGKEYKVEPQGDEFKLVLAESFDKLDEIVDRVLSKMRKQLNENESMDDKMYDFLYSSDTQRNAGTTSYTTCDESDWENAKEYIGGRGKQAFLQDNPDVTEEEFDKYYDEWLERIEDERGFENMNQQDMNW